ncbi:MAG: Rrf2 family transcriptional regulator [Bacteroidales bacterium]|jgi:Rrf2 family protein|nr:Rrf2 family transcriptional regulator [Bacteroidales bacterium]NLH33226.1 Rrf2 family transcriptional regulator [Lentimicrobium sp.]OQC38207.1 MAG: HTH-type transcriptional repressor NsrR [Bacteroidetes bacterium ADurb.Bin041]MBP7874696.1 Rrf2 family transcriptional regulator [Bacteroidales bacterium]MCZ2281867.1 Rrf2 family transcriptional regulator [Bacteroidales bacterium]
MSKIFTLSEAGSIAIHSMVLIARSNDSLNVIKIAELTGSSKHHVAKVLQRLAKEDFLDSNRGPHGGFRLKRSPDQISLLEIYEAIEGKIIVTDCPMDNSKCPFDKCIMENTISTMATEFKNYLDTQKLSDCLE